MCRVLRATAEPSLYHHLRTEKGFDLYFVVRFLAELPDLRSSVFEVDVGESEVSLATHDKACSFTDSSLTQWSLQLLARATYRRRRLPV